MTDPNSSFLRPSVSNGVPLEQAMIRRWWKDVLGGKGVLVWEYYLNGYFADAVIFLELEPGGVEVDGKGAPKRFPISGAQVILCEAKTEFTVELLGQALLYRTVAEECGALIQRSVVLAHRGAEPLKRAAERHGFDVVVSPL